MKHRNKTVPIPKPESKPEAVVRDIKRVTRKKYSADGKIRIMLESLLGETAIAEIRQL